MRRSGSGISTRVSNSIARLRARVGAIAWWVRSISMIWNPMVYTGFSAVIGSWKMTAASLPRIRP